MALTSKAYRRGDHCTGMGMILQKCAKKIGAFRVECPDGEEWNAPMGRNGTNTLRQGGYDAVISRFLTNVLT